MDGFSLQQRADFYNVSFPQYAKHAWLQASDTWLWGIWSIGNNYKGSGYHGSYPPGYLKRVMSMFPDAVSILHLFSGSLDSSIDGDRFDINSSLNPDICGDASDLSNLVTKSYDLIIADPPYTDSDALKYGNPMVSRNTVLKECVKVLDKGGFIAWLDMTLPMYKKEDLNRCISIGIERSTNHRFRQLVGWQKL